MRGGGMWKMNKYGAKYVNLNRFNLIPNVLEHLK